MGVTIYFPPKSSGEDNSVHIAHAKFIEAAGGTLALKAANGQLVGLFASANIMGAVVDP